MATGQGSQSKAILENSNNATLSALFSILDPVKNDCKVINNNCKLHNCSVACGGIPVLAVGALEGLLGVVVTAGACGGVPVLAVGALEGLLGVVVMAGACRGIPVLAVGALEGLLGVVVMAGACGGVPVLAVGALEGLLGVVVTAGMCGGIPVLAVGALEGLLGVVDPQVPLQVRLACELLRADAALKQHLGRHVHHLDVHPQDVLVLNRGGNSPIIITKTLTFYFLFFIFYFL